MLPCQSLWWRQGLEQQQAHQRTAMYDSAQDAGSGGCWLRTLDPSLTKTGLEPWDQCSKGWLPPHQLLQGQSRLLQALPSLPWPSTTLPSWERTILALSPPLPRCCPACEASTWPSTVDWLGKESYLILPDWRRPLLNNARMLLNVPTSAATPARHDWPFVGHFTRWLDQKTGRSVLASIWATSSPPIPIRCIYHDCASDVYIFADITLFGDSHLCFIHFPFECYISGLLPEAYWMVAWCYY